MHAMSKMKFSIELLEPSDLNRIKVDGLKAMWRKRKEKDKVRNSMRASIVYSNVDEKS